MIRVEIFCEEEFEFNEAGIRNEISRVVGQKGLGGNPVEVTVAVIGTSWMRKLHERYMETDEVTDVLSFPQTDDIPGGLTPGPDGIVRLGDIAICFPVAVKQARDGGRSVDEELAFLAGHGCRHLLGEHHD